MALPLFEKNLKITEMKKSINKIFLNITPILFLFFIIGCDEDSISIDTKALEQKIVEATSFLDGKEEGTQPGFYSNRTITKLNNRIEWAQGVLASNPIEQKLIDNAILVLDAGIESIKASEIFSKYPKFTPGTSSMVSPGNIAYAPLDEFTVECRFKPASLNSVSGYGNEIVAHILCTDHQYVGADTGGYALRYYTNDLAPAGQLEFLVGIGAAPPYWSVVSAGVQIQELNKWYHIAATYNASTLTSKIYVDGVKVGEGTFAGPMVHDMANGGPRLGIGYSPMWDITDPAWKRRSNVDGQIIDVRIWGKELSSSEINDRKGDFLTNISQYSSLNAYWPLNAQMGNPVMDATGKYGLNVEGVEWVDPN